MSRNRTRRIRAIEGGRLVLLGRDRLHPRQEVHRVEGRPLPDRHQHHRPKGDRRIGQELDQRLLAEPGDPEVVDEPCRAAVEDPAPGEGHDHRRRRPRQEEHRPRQAPEREPLVEQERHRQAEDELGENRDGGVDRRHPDRVPERGGVLLAEEQLAVVGQPNPRRRLADDLALEAEREPVSSG
jgi:hypothetical protein